MTACATYLKIKIKLLEAIAFAMIDLGATENFMSEKFAKNYQILGLLKEKLYKLMIVDRISLK